MRDVEVRIDKHRARGILFEEAAKAAAGFVDASWEQSIDDFSRACEKSSRTHIAFLGTAILARCVDPGVDVFAIKKGAGDRAYSARSLCHEVLVPNAPELDVNLGVTGREPLNNQPYFRSDRVSRDMTVRSTVRPLIEQLCDILERLNTSDQDGARQALRAFITVRRRFGPRYSEKAISAGELTAYQLVQAVERFVSEESEGGRRAQAVVAALMDLFVGRERVVVRRVNDPSRSVPGDVSVRGDEGWERAFEVRDKPVTREDLYVLSRRSLEAGVAEAVMVAVASTQEDIPVAEAQVWSAQRGVALTVFFNWETLVGQVLLWSPTPQLESVRILPKLVKERLIDLEVMTESVSSWVNLFSKEEKLQ